MAKNDVLCLGPYQYRVKERNGMMVLLEWIESNGVTKELWVDLRKRAA